jgi:hypothetical protein
VLYLEDTQTWPVFQDTSHDVNCELNVTYVASVMRHFDMSDQWAWDAVTDRFFGMPEDRVRRFCASAAAFVNISCSTPLRDEYASIPVRALIDTDPMFTQVQQATGNNLYGGNSSIPQMVAGHTHLFTYGELAVRTVRYLGEAVNGGQHGSPSC